MSTDILIKYINATGRNDLEVIVFSKNYSTNNPKTYYTAWEILKVQSVVEFIYPASISVGATYQYGIETVTIEPIPAKLGSTWNIIQDSNASDVPSMKEGK